MLDRYRVLAGVGYESLVGRCKRNSGASAWQALFIAHGMRMSPMIDLIS
jgi:hypothetical protein